MTPGEYKNGGKDLRIAYHFDSTRLGEILIASTGKGVCYLAFVSQQAAALKELKALYPKAAFRGEKNRRHAQALRFLFKNNKGSGRIALHLKGTAFQLKVWRALLRIPLGELASYSSVAKGIQKDKAVRAVGTAIANNPVAYLIPCHRVIQASGLFGQYRWGEAKKTSLIGWEAARIFR